ncbi:PTS sugar transporter subunit IIA [bacterium]|nr:PTS sugar transporter subunit IIA [bacterium]
MKLAEYITPACIEVGAAADNKEAALRIVSEVAKRHPQMQAMKTDDIYRGFMERERTGSTGFSHAIAIPHFATDTIDEFVVGIVTMPGGVDYKSLDGRPTRLFVFVVAPRSKRDQHLGILSGIARFFRQEGSVEKVMAAESAGALFDFIMKQRQESEPVKVTYDYNLLTVVVQIEDCFQDVLEIFTETEGANISVLEAENAGRYLYNMPLFSSFWSSDHTGFHRIIQCTVKKTSTNQILQKLNSLVDSLDGGKGIMISIVDLIYKNGSLEI